MLNIINLIPFGEKNAISRTALCSITGLCDREVRGKISEARNDYVILSVNHGRGYFRPTPEEKCKVEQWIRTETARANTINKATEAARHMVKE